MNTVKISVEEKNKILGMEESHFYDFKAKEVRPKKVTETLSAFANAEGGEVYIGVDENKATAKKTWTWRGFNDQEEANGFIQAFESLFPLSGEFSYTFLEVKGEEAIGLVLKAEVQKTREIKKASNGKVYVRRGAQKLPLETEEALSRLKRNKGLSTYETETVNSSIEYISESEVIAGFISEVVPHTTPIEWLRKQQLIVNELPTVAGTILFSDEPQILLPKRSGIKLYRYKTDDRVGKRESLDFDPISIEGCAYNQIKRAVEKTVMIIESIRVRRSEGLDDAMYPEVAIHEIVTNAVIHRDYSIADDIHIRIFDNRVEVESPGTLPGHITPQNILKERFSRNGVIVRLINKFPDPPNKDIGEGLNTAFNAMQERELKVPVVDQKENSVIVYLKHERLATPEEIILEYLETHEQVVNGEAREICHIGSENKMKRILQSMVEKDLIEKVPDRSRYHAAYRLRQDSKSAKQASPVQGKLDFGE